MKQVILKLLHYSEYLIPLVFFWFTHFIDEKIHKHWENANYHPDKMIRLINRYQWEICFLVISLLAILGIKIAHRSQEDAFYYGLVILGASAILIGLLFGFAIKILNDEEQRMSPVIFYSALFIYIIYITLDIYFQQPSEQHFFVIGSYTVARYFVFIAGLVVFLILFFILKNDIDKKLMVVLLDPDDIDYNIGVYKNERTSSVKKAEALGYIISYYHEQKTPGKVREWIETGERDYPAKTARIKRRLGL